MRDQGEFDGSGPYNSPQTEYIVFDPEQVKSLDPVTYDDNGELIPLSDRFNPENVDIRWHESEGGGSVPRFTETPLGQELVAEALLPPLFAFMYHWKECDEWKNCFGNKESFEIFR